MESGADSGQALKAQVNQRKFLPARTEYHRMNFLLQASDLLMKQSRNVANAHVADGVSPPSLPMPRLRLRKNNQIKGHAGKKRAAQGDGTVDLADEPTASPANIARIFPQQAKTVASKAVLRLSPKCKRSICRRCWIQLDPGFTAVVRFRKDKQKRLFKITTCLECGYFSRQPCDSGYTSRTDQSEQTIVP